MVIMSAQGLKSVVGRGLNTNPYGGTEGSRAHLGGQRKAESNFREAGSMAKQKKQPTIDTVLVDTVERVRKDVESTVQSIGKAAVELLPKSSRDQVDSVIERLDEVRSDVDKRVNKTVKTVSKDLQKRFKVVSGTIDKRVKTVRKEADVRRKKAVSQFEKETRKRAEAILKWLKVPTRGDIDQIKRRVTNLERRVDSLVEKRERVAA